MKLYVNSKEMELPASSSMEDLAKQLQLPDKGIAMAVNNQMIPRGEWQSHTLQENDRIIIIKAACGG